LTASPFLLADLKMAGFGFVVAGDSEGCDGELAVDFDGVARTGADGDLLIEHCCVAVSDFGLPGFVLVEKWYFVTNSTYK
jgi:hypothetical protein